MCGIVGYIGPRQAAPILLEGLSKLRDLVQLKKAVVSECVPLIVNMITIIMLPAQFFRKIQAEIMQESA